MKYKLAALALMAGLTVQAHADDLSYTSPTAHSFNDVLSFELPAGTSSVSALGSILSGSGIFTATLFSSGVDTGKYFAFGGSSGSSGTQTFAGLTGGEYSFDIKSLTSTSVKYNFSATIASVPEPETYALALVGLVAVGGGLYRRKKTGATA